VDAYGNLYIADYYNSRIRKVDTNGIITTVAGDGTNGYSGDGGAASNAWLYCPSGVAVDAYGNLYIADYYNSRIRKVDTNGIITTVAGDGTNGYSGDGGVATNARVYYPSGVAVDAYGNLYIADSDNSRIRKVDTNGIITTVAGTNGSGYSGDGGAATNARLAYPEGPAMDTSGNLYIADTDNSRIRKVLLYAGYPMFTLNNVAAINAGDYSVVITTPYGSVTSAVATLTVQAPPQIVTGDGSFGFVGSQFGFNVSAGAGLTIVVDGSTDLLRWTPLVTNTAGGTPFYFCDPGWTNSPWRFYRARLP
jgi:sugar lactone lactonase YvrE